ARRVMQYKYASTKGEAASLNEKAAAIVAARPELTIPEWSAAFVEADPAQIGLPGSPTKVKTVENVVFTAKESRRLENDDAQIEELIKELIANHTIG
ncbi:MAG: electron transfer flavoprotein beta subunit/FixA family protein, partial [Muribaculaceae bacterium]|nr:electron transfer flavoprotein beta subunit/FixA family protein [Muribaculaceae bacterium]